MLKVVTLNATSNIGYERWLEDKDLMSILFSQGRIQDFFQGGGDLNWQKILRPYRVRVQKIESRGGGYGA